MKQERGMFGNSRLELHLIYKCELHSQRKWGRVKNTG